MKEVKVEALMWLTKNQVFSIPDGVYSVRFTDGVVNMTKPQIVISWHYWEMYRGFKVKTISVKSAVVEHYTSDSHRKYGKIVVWEVFNQIENPSEETFWNVSETFYDITNQIYNTSCDELSEYITTMSMIDLMEIYREPKIVNEKENFRSIVEDPKSTTTDIKNAIYKCYTTNMEILNNSSNYLGHNGVKKLVSLGLTSSRQINQIVGPRGSVKDIDGRIFPNVIEVGYFEGLSTLYDSITESRSASYSMLMNQLPLESAEYLNRTIQLVVACILDWDRSLGESCTGFGTVPYLVDSKRDEVLLRGKYHMLENGKPELIWGDINHLIGKVINIRSIVACGHHDPQYTCKTCLGFIHRIIPPDSNLGATIILKLCEILAQTMLSNKHVIESAGVTVIKFDKVGRRWFTLRNGLSDSIFLTEYALRDPVILRIDIDNCKHLPQILHTDINELNVNRISTMKEVNIGHLDKDGNCYGILDTSYLEVAGVGVHFSKELLKYIKAHSWSTHKGYIEIELKDWNPNKPIFSVPQVGEDIWTFFINLRSFILASGNKANVEKISKFNTRGDAIGELITILRQGIPEFNFAQVEILVRSLMVVEASEERFDMPTIKEPFKFVGLKKIISNRNLSSMLAYERQFDCITAEHWANNKKNSKHPFDYML